ncbi:SDR family oxidoreductase [Gordonia sp. NB41Y]|uniref:SDR family oxidoreductase n=1 Tax=Gordonia sp. NB41Y TaxID=875808 RepID=UPI0002C03F73|nr:SDR family oxidoreductase [Gordonia sp. NB41Y]EMP14987.1 oxidoreductase [Gordonia sp. NB41Y]WLP88530.1 SDR family oxidoreductase [Gordonia sp. NB41Y]
MTDSVSVGRTVVITGAASGIGLALVRRILDREPDTQIVAVDIAPCPETRAQSVRCDLSDPEAIAGLELPEHIDALANVAGVPGTAPAETVLAVNTLGLRTLTFRALEHMGAGGAIVNVASLAAHRNTLPHEDIVSLLEVGDRDELRAWLGRTRLDGPAAYDSSKRAVVDWTVALSAQLQPRGIRALTVSPGPTETPILTDFEESMGVDAIARSASLVGRHGSAAESASVIDFAIGPAAAWVNGIDIPVDGGLTGLRAASIPLPLSRPRARVDLTE